MIDEFRRAPRRKVSDNVLVTDAMTERVVGRIGNLSETGMLLIASAPLNDDALYQFRFPCATRAATTSIANSARTSCGRKKPARPGCSGSACASSPSPTTRPNA